MTEPIRIERATEKDIPLILTFIKELAEYERLSEQCVATEALLHAIRTAMSLPDRTV